MDRLDRKDLKDAAFDVVLRGYDKRQVDERLRFLGAELTAADSALRAVGERGRAAGGCVERGALDPRRRTTW